jgi:hypothetical protein
MHFLHPARLAAVVNVALYVHVSPLARGGACAEQGRVRFGQLDREAQKAITKVCKLKHVGGGCDMEMAMLMRCLKRTDFDAISCTTEAEALTKCTETAGDKVSVCSCVACA